MRRPVALAALLALSVGRLALAVDGGVATTQDAGVGDGGQGAPRPAGERWSWTYGDGGWLLDGGVTDVLRLGVGETAEVKLPFPIILMQCDAQLLSLGATTDTLLLTGKVAGHTQCGFWWFKQAWPNRFMDVTVTPAP